MKIFVNLEYHNYLYVINLDTQEFDTIDLPKNNSYTINNTFIIGNNYFIINSTGELFKLNIKAPFVPFVRQY